MSNKNKFIKDAIVWFKYAQLKGKWLRASDMNLVESDGDKPYYISPYAPNIRYRTVYPYEDWMEKYIGTDNRELFEKLKDISK